MSKILKTPVLTVFTVLFLWNTSFAQKASIRGKIFDKFSLTPLPDASVVILGTNIGDASDSAGAYLLENLIAGTYFIEVTLIGYENKIVKNVSVKSGEVKTLDIGLRSTTLQLPEVAIEAERLWEKYLTEASLINVQRMRSKDLINIPGTIDDPTRAIQVFSGVTGGGDYSGFMAVRGGSPDQNQVIIDGIIVPSPYRFRLAFGGGLSNINPGTTENLYLHLGGFSAEYGNSLSSILEVESRIGNPGRIRMQGSLNFTDINGLVDGPMGKIGTFIFSVRRTYYDFIANSLSQSDSAFPFYFEISNKFTVDLNKSNRIAVNFTRNREGTELLDEFSEDLNLTEDGTSYLTSVSWRSLWGKKWQLNTSFSYYQDRFKYRAFSSDSLSQNPNYETLDSKIINWGFKADTRYQTGAESWLNWGISITRVPARVAFEAARRSFSYARAESPGEVNFDETYHYYATYLESSTHATENLHLRLGLRYDYSTLVEEGELSPRFSVWYRLSDRTKLEGSWGLFYQYPEPTSLYNRNIPVDVSQNLDIISAEKAVHLILGVEHAFNDDYSARLQLYNKDLDRLLLPVDETTFAPVNKGTGFARGFELILQKKPSTASRFSALLSYAFGKGQYRNLDTVEWLPFKYDRRHALTFFANVRLVGNWSLSILGQYSSGFPFTEIKGLVNRVNFAGNSSWELLPGARFRSRFPSFKKIDARLSYQHRVGQKALSFYLDVINITNQRNVYEITWEKKYLPDDRQQATKRVIYMLPLIPSFGVSFRL